MPDQPPAPPQPTPAQQNSISEDVEIKGNLIFGKSLITHGRIEGDVLAPGTLTVGNTGRVQGDISVGAVAIHGKVSGNVTVQERCELKGNAQLFGDLEAPRLVMEEGATFVGNCKVTPRGSTPPAPQPPKPNQGGNQPGK